MLAHENPCSTAFSSRGLFTANMNLNRGSLYVTKQFTFLLRHLLLLPSYVCFLHDLCMMKTCVSSLHINPHSHPYFCFSDFFLVWWWLLTHHSSLSKQGLHARSAATCQSDSRHWKCWSHHQPCLQLPAPVAPWPFTWCATATCVHLSQILPLTSSGSHPACLSVRHHSQNHSCVVSSEPWISYCGYRDVRPRQREAKGRRVGEESGEADRETEGGRIHLGGRRGQHLYEVYKYRTLRGESCLCAFMSGSRKRGKTRTKSNLLNID